MCNMDALHYKSNGKLQNLEMRVADKMSLWWLNNNCSNPSVFVLELFRVK